MRRREQPQVPATTTTRQGLSNSNLLIPPTNTTPGEKQPTNTNQGVDQAATTATSCSEPTPVLSFHVDPSNHFEAMVASLEVLIQGMPKGTWKHPDWSLLHSKMHYNMHPGNQTQNDFLLLQCGQACIPFA